MYKSYVCELAKTKIFFKLCVAAEVLKSYIHTCIHSYLYSYTYIHIHRYVTYIHNHDILTRTAQVRMCQARYHAPTAHISKTRSQKYIHIHTAQVRMCQACFHARKAANPRIVAVTPKAEKKVKYAFIHVSCACIHPCIIHAHGYVFNFYQPFKRLNSVVISRHFHQLFPRYSRARLRHIILSYARIIRGCCFVYVYMDLHVYVHTCAHPQGMGASKK
jgi:hypothetical protein